MKNINTENTEISVLMSVYNGERWLDESIISILNQNFSNFEFIIINDGSNDSSESIINKYALIDTRIILISKPNTGLADSLNEGIKIARGSWIARLDADDLCDPERLKIQYEKAKSDQKLVFIGTDLIEISETGIPIKTHHYPCSHKELENNLISLKKFVPHSSAFFKTEAIRSLGGYRKRIKRSQDFDMWLRLSEIGQLGNIDKPLVSNRLHPDQVSHEDYGKRQLIDARIALISYWIRKNGNPDPIESSEQEFNDFKLWAINNLNIDQLIKINIMISKLKKTIEGKPLSLKTLFNFMKILLLNLNTTLKYLNIFLFGESTPKRLAKLWINK